MRKRTNGNTTQVWLSAEDTYRWAHRAGRAWPNSQLSGRRVYAEFEGGDLVDLMLDEGRENQDCDASEFNACIADHFGSDRP